MHRWGRRCFRYRGSACVDGEVERSGLVECVDEHVVVESCPSDDVVALVELDVEDDVVAEFVVEEFVEEAVDGEFVDERVDRREVIHRASSFCHRG